MAVLHINDHWVVGRRSSNKDVFEIIDYPRKYYLPVDVVNELWEGFAIVIRRRRLLSSWQMLGAGAISVSLLGIVALVLSRRLVLQRYKRFQ